MFVKEEDNEVAKMQVRLYILKITCFRRAMQDHRHSFKMLGGNANIAFLQ